MTIDGAATVTRAARLDQCRNAIEHAFQAKLEEVLGVDCGAVDVAHG